MIPQKKALHFPTWAEALMILLFAAMSIFEARHASWFWFILFALAAICFAASLIARLGKKDA